MSSLSRETVSLAGWSFLLAVLLFFAVCVEIMLACCKRGYPEYEIVDYYPRAVLATDGGQPVIP